MVLKLNEKAVIKMMEKLGRTEFEKKGHEIWCSCPIPGHDDSHPSFAVVVSSREKRGKTIRPGSWSCWSCGASSHAEHLVMRCLDIEWDAASRWLEENVCEIEECDVPPSIDELRKKNEEVVESNEQAISIPLPPVLDKNSAIDYLVGGRGGRKPVWDWDDAARAIDLFGGGMARDGYWKDGIIIPLRYPNGDHAAFMAEASRKDCPFLKDGEGKGWKRFPRGFMKSETVPGIELCQRGSSVVIVEGVWDALRLWSWEIPSACILGSLAGKRQVAAIISKCSEVIIALDNDDAGRKGTRRLIGELFDFVNVKAALCPADPDEMREKELRSVLRNAKMVTA